MDQRGEIDIGGASPNQIDEVPVDAGIFGLLLVHQHALIQHEPRAARGENQPAAAGLYRDVPGLRPGLQEVELGADGYTLNVGEIKRGCDGRVAIFWEGERGVVEEEGVRQDARQDRQRVDARVEHAEPARLEDPGLARVPNPDILLPGNGDRARGVGGEKVAGWLNGRREA